MKHVVGFKKKLKYVKHELFNNGQYNVRIINK